MIVLAGTLFICLFVSAVVKTAKDRQKNQAAYDPLDTQDQIEHQRQPAPLYQAEMVELDQHSAGRRLTKK
jgi:hypothetical protein